MSSDRRHRVVVVGGGFGGLQAARRLRRAPVDVALVDRRNYHLFQPLLYQVATGALSAAEIAAPLRALFTSNPHFRVVLGDVTGFDLESRVVAARLPSGVGARFDYDTLVVAAGSQYTYFGHDEWRPFAPDIKGLDEAVDVRRRILGAFEAAELERDAAARTAWLTFVVVGGGPTGVELAGQIAEIARDTLRGDFREIDPADARIVLVEMADRVLTGFPARLSHRAQQALRQLGVEPVLGTQVVDVDGGSVTLSAGDATRRLETRTVVWAAGVVASPLAEALARQSGAELDRGRRIVVEPDLTLPGHPEVFVIGDMAHVAGERGNALPGLAPVAMQQGRYVGRVVRARLRGAKSKPFHYRDKGNLATIGRAKAVADVKHLQLSGFVAWVTWLFVHLFYLIGFQNRLLVFLRWTFSFFTHGRGARLITNGQATSR